MNGKPGYIVHIAFSFSNFDKHLNSEVKLLKIKCQKQLLHFNCNMVLEHPYKYVKTKMLIGLLHFHFYSNIIQMGKIKMPLWILYFHVQVYIIT